MAPQAYQDAICTKLGCRLDAIEGKLDGQAGAHTRWPAHGSLSNANLVTGSPLRHGGGVMQGSPTRDALAAAQATGSPSLWKAPERSALAALHAGADAHHGAAATRSATTARSAAAATGAAQAGAGQDGGAGAGGQQAGGGDAPQQAGDAAASPMQQACDVNPDSQGDRLTYGFNSQPAKGLDSQDIMAALMPTNSEPLLGGSQLLALTQQNTQFDSEGNIILSQPPLDQVFNDSAKE